MLRAGTLIGYSTVVTVPVSSTVTEGEVQVPGWNASIILSLPCLGPENVAYLNLEKEISEKISNALEPILSNKSGEQILYLLGNKFHCYI